jgi:limonene-1,2-epoxide hydrolase
VRQALALGAVLVVAAAGSGAAVATPTPAQVVRAWSKALNANDNEAAANLFAHDALVVEGPVAVPLSSHKLAVAFNDSLPCAGKIVALDVKGITVTATFVLGHRPKHACDGPGEKAAALFIVRKGKIVHWARVPVPKPKPPGI